MPQERRELYNTNPLEWHTNWFFVFCGMFYVMLVLAALLFYRHYDGYGPGYSFYFAVNAALNVGYNNIHSEDDTSTRVTTFIMLIGFFAKILTVLFVLAAVFKSEREWYRKLRKYHKRNERDIQTQIKEFFEDNQSIFISLAVFSVVFLFGVFFYLYYVGFDVTYTFFFVISTITASGLAAIPATSSDTVFGITGLFTLLGVFLFALYVGFQLKILRNYEEKYRAEKALEGMVTVKEIMGLRELGLEPKAGKMDKLEFILLAIMRMDILNVELVVYLEEVFAELKKGDDGLFDVPTLHDSKYDTDDDLDVSKRDRVLG